MVDQSDEVCSKLMEIVKNHSAQIHYYKIFVKGLPHARNYGIRRAIGEVIIFCDDDVIPGHNFIENHLQNYQEKDVGGVGGRIIPDWNQSHDNSMYRNFNTTLYPPVNGGESSNSPVYLGTKGGPPYSCRRPNSNRRYKAIGKIRWWDAHLIDNFDAIEKAYIDHAQGCNMSFRKEAVIKAGGFDERFWRKRTS